jgi:septum formation protein
MNFPPITTENPLVLASASPRRRDLLKQLELPFIQVSSNAKEEILRGDPLEDAGRIAEEKARHILMTQRNHWILGADTMVVLNDRILGKPSNPEEAGSMLRFLAGKKHRVITGFSILDPAGGLSHREAVTTIVKMKELSDKEIQGYMSTGEPFGKAGSYAVQGIGAFMVESIQGSYTNVVGLPLCSLIKALVRVKALMNYPQIP